MSDAYTSTSLIESVKRKAHVPTSQTTFRAQDFLDFATEEMRLGICPAVMSVHEDYFLFEIDVPIVSGRLEYEIPSRAMGNKLRDVQYKLANNNYIEMTRIGIGDRFNQTQSNSYSSMKRFYVKNNRVVLMNVQDASSSPAWLTMIFYIKPSKMVEDSKVAIISGINRTSGAITLSNLPTEFTSQVSYDLYKSGSPFNILKIDLPIENINSTTKTIIIDPSSIPDELTIGDHMAKAGECCIPQIPSELHPMLAQMVTCRVLEAQGDSEGLKNANDKLTEMKGAAGVLVDNRVDDAPQKIINRYSLTRLTAFSRYWGR